jgi:hypothetical protein
LIIAICEDFWNRFLESNFRNVIILKAIFLWLYQSRTTYETHHSFIHTTIFST